MKPGKGKCCSKTKCKGCASCKEPDIKKEVFAPVKKEDTQGPTLEDQNRLLLDQIFRTRSGKDILKELETMFGMHPLLIVASVGHVIGLDKLISAGVDINVQHPLDGNTALHLAAKGGHTDIVKLLITAKADLSITNTDGNNPLMMAIEAGLPAPVNLLWQHRDQYNINHPNKNGSAAIHIAAERCWESCVTMLISGGAAKNFTANDGTTALIIAAKKGDKKTCEKLVEHGANILLEDNDDCTAICVSVREQKRDIARYLVNKLDHSDREAYVKRRVDLLTMLPDTEETDEFFEETLYPIFRCLSKHHECRGLFHTHALFEHWISAVHRHLENETVTDKAFHFMTEMMSVSFCEPAKVDEEFIREFLSADGPALCLQAIAMYKECNSVWMISSAMLPLLALVEVDEGREWLVVEYYKISEFLATFEKDKGELDYTEGMANRIDVLWEAFQENFNAIQAVQAEHHGAELMEGEERERIKRERKREKRRQRRQLQRAKGAAQRAAVTCCQDTVPPPRDLDNQEEVLESEAKDPPTPAVKSSKSKRSIETTPVIKISESETTCTNLQDLYGQEPSFEKVLPKKKAREMRKLRKAELSFTPEAPADDTVSLTSLASHVETNTCREPSHGLTKVLESGVEGESLLRRGRKLSPSLDRPDTPDCWDPDETKSPLMSTNTGQNRFGYDSKEEMSSLSLNGDTTLNLEMTFASNVSEDVGILGTEEHQLGETKLRYIIFGESGKDLGFNGQPNEEVTTPTLDFIYDPSLEPCTINAQPFMSVNDQLETGFEKNSPIETVETLGGDTVDIKTSAIDRSKECDVNFIQFGSILDIKKCNLSLTGAQRLDTEVVKSGGLGSGTHHVTDLESPESQPIDNESTQTPNKAVNSWADLLKGMGDKTSTPFTPLKKNPDKNKIESRNLKYSTSEDDSPSKTEKVGSPKKRHRKRNKAKRRGTTIPLGEFLTLGLENKDTRQGEKGHMTDEYDTQITGVEPLCSTETEKCPPDEAEHMKDVPCLNNKPADPGHGESGRTVLFAGNSKQLPPAVKLQQTEMESGALDTCIKLSASPLGDFWFGSLLLQEHAMLEAPLILGEAAKVSGVIVTDRNLLKPFLKEWLASLIKLLITIVAHNKIAISMIELVKNFQIDLDRVDWNDLPLHRHQDVSQDLSFTLVGQLSSLLYQLVAVSEPDVLFGNEGDTNERDNMMTQDEWMAHVFSPPREAVSSPLVNGDVRASLLQLRTLISVFLSRLWMRDQYSNTRQALYFDDDMQCPQSVMSVGSKSDVIHVEVNGKSPEETQKVLLGEADCTRTRDHLNMVGYPCEPNNVCLTSKNLAFDVMANFGEVPVAKSQDLPGLIPSRNGEFSEERRLDLVGLHDHFDDMSRIKEIPINETDDQSMISEDRSLYITRSKSKVSNEAAGLDCSNEEVFDCQPSDHEAPVKANLPTLNPKDDCCSHNERELLGTLGQNMKNETGVVSQLIQESEKTTSEGPFFYNFATPPTSNFSNVTKTPLKSQLIDLSLLPPVPERSPEFLLMTHDPDVLFDYDDPEYIPGTIIKKRWLKEGFFNPEDAITRLLKGQGDQWIKKRETPYNPGTNNVFSGEPLSVNLQQRFGSGDAVCENFLERKKELDESFSNHHCHYWLPSDIAGTVDHVGHVSGDACLKNSSAKCCLNFDSKTNAGLLKEEMSQFGASTGTANNLSRETDDVETNCSDITCYSPMPDWSRWRTLLNLLEQQKACYSNTYGRIKVPSPEVMNKFSLGSSTRGFVCLGLVDNKMEVAVRMIQRKCVKDEKHLLQLADTYHLHRNICNYLCCELDVDYIYIASELCEVNLAYYMTHRPVIDCSQATLDNLVKELVEGVEYLHSNSIFHGRLKAENVLIDPKGVLRICDFGFGKQLDDSIGGDCDYSLDVKAVGRLTSFILTEGRHTRFIEEGSSFVLDEELTPEASDLICSVLADPSGRAPSIHRLHRHPYFWDSLKKYNFLVFFMQPHFMPSNQKLFTRLEVEKNKILPNGWRGSIDPALISELEADQLCVYRDLPRDLLLFMKNSQYTWKKRSLKFQSVIDLQGEFFLGRFPRLFMAVYSIIKDGHDLNSVEKYCDMYTNKMEGNI